MKKEYKIDITPTASGDLYTVEVMHDGAYVGEMRRFFNHRYAGKGANRKIVELARNRADAYVAELVEKGYEKVKA